MDKQDVLTAIAACEEAIVSRDKSSEPRRARGNLRGPTDAAMLDHARWMIPEAKEFVVAGRHDKSLRWLGFIQGVLWATQVCTIDELKEMNRSKKEIEVARLVQDLASHLRTLDETRAMFFFELLREKVYEDLEDKKEG